MKALNKKIVTLACATCLTVGMGAVVCADTVDLGYGLYGTTGTSVAAKEIVHIPSDPGLRTREQNEMVNRANTSAVKAINETLKSEYSIPVEPIKGSLIDGISLYQLQGSDAQGHHVGYFASFDYSKNLVDQIIGMEKTILEKGSDADKAKLKYPLSTYVQAYSKAEAQHQLQSLRGEEVDEQKLIQAVNDINSNIPTQLSDALSKSVMNDDKMSSSDKQELINMIKFGTKQIQVGATYASYKPVTTQYGTAVNGTLRGSINYDGFKAPFSLIGYVVPTDKGVTVQYLLSEDSSHDYWAQELNRLYQTKSLKGGK